MIRLYASHKSPFPLFGPQPKTVTFEKKNSHMYLRAPAWGCTKQPDNGAFLVGNDLHCTTGTADMPGSKNEHLNKHGAGYHTVWPLMILELRRPRFGGSSHNPSLDELSPSF